MGVFLINNTLTTCINVCHSLSVTVCHSHCQLNEKKLDISKKTTAALKKIQGGIERQAGTRSRLMEDMEAIGNGASRRVGETNNIKLN
jgi:hypothetical protein